MTLPTSARFLFYEAEQLGAVSKVATGARRPDQDFGDAVMQLRERGLVPWSWIVDETRTLHDWPMAPTVLDYAAGAIDGARIDPWIGAVRPVILTEARTTAGVFARTFASDYRVATAATNGQAGGFLVTEIAPKLIADTIVLYVGDLDLAGNSIEANTRERLSAHAEREVPWIRVAVTERQGELLRDAGAEPIRKTDRRYTDGRPHEAFEAEALGQEVLSQLVVDALDQLLPEPLGAVLEREAGERAVVLARLGT
jgi:hypothetical protein